MNNTTENIDGAIELLRSNIHAMKILRQSMPLEALGLFDTIVTNMTTAIILLALEASNKLHEFNAEREKSN